MPTLQPGDTQSWSGRLDVDEPGGECHRLSSLNDISIGDLIHDWLYKQDYDTDDYEPSKLCATVTITITDVIPPPPKRTHTPIPKAPALFGRMHEVALLSIARKWHVGQPTHQLLWQEGSRKAILRNNKGDRFISVRAALLYMAHNNGMWLGTWTPHNLAHAAAYPDLPPHNV